MQTKMNEILRKIEAVQADIESLMEVAEESEAADEVQDSLTDALDELDHTAF